MSKRINKTKELETKQKELGNKTKKELETKQKRTRKQDVRSGDLEMRNHDSCCAQESTKYTRKKYKKSTRKSNKEKHKKKYKKSTRKSTRKVQENIMIEMNPQQFINQ
jgi:hypothetical protein